MFKFFYCCYYWFVPTSDDVIADVVHASVASIDSSTFLNDVSVSTLYVADDSVYSYSDVNTISYFDSVIFVSGFNAVDYVDNDADSSVC